MSALGPAGFDPGDLLPEGERVSPAAIADGFMREVAVIHDGRVRHLPYLTGKGVKHLMAELREDGTLGSAGGAA